MSKRNCLNCKWEPNWSEPIGIEYARQHGSCKYSMPDIKLPECSSPIYKNSVERYSDDSGICSNCKVWESK